MSSLLLLFTLHPATGRDKSLHYMVGSRNGHVGQGFSPASFDFRPLTSDLLTFCSSALLPDLCPPISGALTSDTPTSGLFFSAIAARGCSVPEQGCRVNLLNILSNAFYYPVAQVVLILCIGQTLAFPGIADE